MLPRPRLPPCCSRGRGWSPPVPTGGAGGIQFARDAAASSNASSGGQSAAATAAEAGIPSDATAAAERSPRVGPCAEVWLIPPLPPPRPRPPPPPPRPRPREDTDAASGRCTGKAASPAKAELAAGTEEFSRARPARPTRPTLPLIQTPPRRTGTPDSQLLAEPATAPVPLLQEVIVRGADSRERKGASGWNSGAEACSTRRPPAEAATAPSSPPASIGHSFQIVELIYLSIPGH